MRACNKMKRRRLVTVQFEVGIHRLLRELLNGVLGKVTGQLLDQPSVVLLVVLRGGTRSASESGRQGKRKAETNDWVVEARVVGVQTIHS